MDRTVRNSATGKTFQAPPRYWVQAREGETFEVKGKYWVAQDARDSAKFTHETGRYAEVVVQNVDTGRRIAQFI